MPTKIGLGIDGASPPFDQFTSIQRLAPARSGHQSPEHARHQLYVAREKRNPVNVLIKVTSKPGQVYEQDLTNEISSLSTINRELPDSRYFPVIHQHGRLSDGRLYLSTSLFDEFPLATTIGAAPVPGKLVAHLEARDRDRQGIDRHPSPGDLPRRSESDECPVPGKPRPARDPDRRLRVVVRARPPFERRLLQSSDDSGILGAGSLTPGTGRAFGPVLARSGAPHDAGRVPMDGRRGGQRARRGRSGARRGAENCAARRGRPRSGQPLWVGRRNFSLRSAAYLERIWPGRAW